MWRFLQRDPDTSYAFIEHAIMLVLAVLLLVVAAMAGYRLVLGVGTLVLDGFDPTQPEVLQSVLGSFFTVLIVLEFRRSLVMVQGPNQGVVRVRSIILIGMLATVRKFIVADLAHTEFRETLALSAAILALGIVYWLVRDQDRRAAVIAKPHAEREAPPP